MTDPIIRLARRVDDDPFFVASALREYAASENLDEAALAARLGCSVETLARVALCRRPHPSPPRFREDLARIATRFGVKPDVLAEMLRRAAVLERARRGGAAEHGTLMAARDRESPAEPGSPDPETGDHP